MTTSKRRELQRRKLPVRRAQLNAIRQMAKVKMPCMETPRISPILGTVVPLESYLPDKEANEPSNFPDTAKFTTISNNVTGTNLSELVKLAIKKGMEKQNKITCGCRPGQDCAANPKCKCRGTSNLLGFHYNNKPLRFGEPIKLDPHSYEKPMFACHSSCGCKGKCNVNGLRDIDTDHEKKFAIVRDINKGFCLFTKRDIEKGMPVITFNGELIGTNTARSDKNIEQYSLLLTTEHDKMQTFFANCDIINNEYRKVLREAYNRITYVNPLNKGNCARFLSHSCGANLELTRVFQGGLSPADIRVVLIAKESIPAGTELTFDYGCEYKEKFLGNDCMCILCLESKAKKTKKYDSQRGKNEIHSEEPLQKKFRQDSSAKKSEVKYACQIEPTVGKNGKYFLRQQPKQEHVRLIRSSRIREQQLRHEEMKEEDHCELHQQAHNSCSRKSSLQVHSETAYENNKDRFRRGKSQGGRVENDPLHSMTIKTRQQSRLEALSNERDFRTPVAIATKTRNVPENQQSARELSEVRAPQQKTSEEHIVKSQPSKISMRTRSYSRLANSQNSGIAQLNKLEVRQTEKITRHDCNTHATRSQARLKTETIEGDANLTQESDISIKSPRCHHLPKNDQSTSSTNGARDMIANQKDISFLELVPVDFESHDRANVAIERMQETRDVKTSQMNMLRCTSQTLVRQNPTRGQQSAQFTRFDDMPVLSREPAQVHAEESETVPERRIVTAQVFEISRNQPSYNQPSSSVSRLNGMVQPPSLAGSVAFFRIGGGPIHIPKTLIPQVFKNSHSLSFNKHQSCSSNSFMYQPSDSARQHGSWNRPVRPNIRPSRYSNQ